MTAFPSLQTIVPCDSSHVYDDEETIEQLSKAQVTVIDRDDDQQLVNREFQFLQKHSIQRRYTLEFVKYSDPLCTHCSRRPVRAKKLVTFLGQSGGCVLPPQPSLEHPGHYKTWREMAAKAMSGQLVIPQIDEGISGVSEDEAI